MTKVSDVEKEKKKSGKGVPRKKYNKPTKDMIQKILDESQSQNINQDYLVKTFGISPGMGNNIINYISNTQWKKLDEGDEKILPKGYYIPKNVNQIIDSVLFDRGMMKVE